MSRLITFCLLVFVPATFALAQEKDQGAGPSPYTECGIGAALFPNTNWAAATSNAIWDLGTTAVISALSSPETCNAKKMETARLILETLPSLEKDVAVGEGEYLASLNETMDCNADSAASLNSALRVSYVDVVADAEYANRTQIEKAEKMYSVVKSVVDGAPGSCSAVL